MNLRIKLMQYRGWNIYFCFYDFQWEASRGLELFCAKTRKQLMQLIDYRESAQWNPT